MQLNLVAVFLMGSPRIHNYGWSEVFRKDLGSPVGATVTRNVTGPQLNHDFYEFNWGGFSIDIKAKGAPLFSVGFILVKRVHQMASVHLRIAQTTLYLKGYEKMNLISHSWGTTLAYDLLMGGGIEMNHWVTMGSPLNHEIGKPVWNTGNWINAFSTRDPFTYLDMYPNSLIHSAESPVFLPRLATSPFNPAGVDVSVNTTAGVGGMSMGEHGAYWTQPTLLTTLRTRLQ